jgi:Sulfotransferase family
MTLPDFFIVGAPKAGTTALHAALADHPQLFLSRVKEPKFFLCDGPPPQSGGPGDAHSYREWIWRREDYEALFEGAPAGALRGESTPLYLADHAAHRRIHELVPHAKLIAVLRDPVDRAYSSIAGVASSARSAMSAAYLHQAPEPDRRPGLTARTAQGIAPARGEDGSNGACTCCTMPTIRWNRRFRCKPQRSENLVRTDTRPGDSAR